MNYENSLERGCAFLVLFWSAFFDFQFSSLFER